MFRWKKLQRIYEKNRSDFFGLVFRRYPDFILSNRISHLEIAPVFTFHEVTESTLEPLLIYLSKNDYKTLNADELFERENSSNINHNKEVVLTFDDGHISLYEVAYPLLKKYGFKAVAFIIPGLITEGKSDGWQTDKKYLCSWNEIKIMHESGVIDIQAHSMYHHTIFISPRIIDYVSPDSNFSFLREALFPVLVENDSVRFPDSLPLGTPIYDSDYRYGRKRKYFDSIALRRACQDYVNENGSSSFFENSGWKNQLNSMVRKKFKDLLSERRYESQEERKETLAKDLREAKDSIEMKLSGKRIKHLCFPWFTADDATVTASGEVGYNSNFWGGFIPKFAKDRKEPLPIKRYNPIYIWRLPGKNRKSINEVVYKKISGMVFQ